ncbi:helix-turn-helix transcriptional regulator [Anaerotignum sp.]|uniref:helix-turn-helix transcriptional regulator n=1 Tax=Anaerotignum sp. TaxID=2039241 RepID=UPI003735B114
MAYSELVKNFNRIREYMREFYVYGFKSRDEYTRKSARSYDDERRRLESWLGDYMGFRQNTEGKNVFISIDSRSAQHNPLYKAWKTKSFTDGDITLHFILMDIFACAKEPLSLTEITEQIDVYLSVFQEPKTFDVSTVRKKLKEYISEGIVWGEKRGKTMYYRWTMSKYDLDRNVLDFFSEIAPCGVIGSFLLDQTREQESHFAFKHHYITGAVDSEILCTIFMAIRERRSVMLETLNRHKEHPSQSHVVPLRVMVSAQSGRQYLMAYSPRFRRILSFRTDHIVSVEMGEGSERFDQLRLKLDEMQKNMWGVSTQSRWGNRMEHVEFTIRYGANEQHIPKRLEREKRCGTVEHLDENTSRFTADVYDSSELIPWIRTFLCRITELHFSNEKLEKQFREDIEDMYALYGLEDGENDDIQ